MKEKGRAGESHEREGESRTEPDRRRGEQERAMKEKGRATEEKGRAGERAMKEKGRAGESNRREGGEPEGAMKDGLLLLLHFDYNLLYTCKRVSHFILGYFALHTVLQYHLSAYLVLQFISHSVIQCVIPFTSVSLNTLILHYVLK